MTTILGLDACHEDVAAALDTFLGTRTDMLLFANYLLRRTGDQ